MSNVQTTIKAATSEASGPACFIFIVFIIICAYYTTSSDQDTNFSQIKLNLKPLDTFSRLFLFSWIRFFLILILGIRDPYTLFIPPI